VIERILPPGVASAEAFGDPPDASLLPGEDEVVALAVEKRRREFTTARSCARAALAKIGVPPVAIPSGPRGAPEWPPGVVGSITHCAGYRAAAVARASDLAALGIEVRAADFDADGNALATAFRGASRLLLISTDRLDVPGLRLAQHQRAIAAAVAAGVQHVVYTSMPSPETSRVSFAPEHAGTERAL